MDNLELIMNYIKDTISIIKDEAIVTKNNYKMEKDEQKKVFNDGMVMGYYSIISLLQQQAEAFNIELKDLNLHDIDPDKDLL